MSTCANCKSARQVGDKSRQDVVGCRRIAVGDINPWEVTERLFEGYFYSDRYPGDVEDTKAREGVGRGVLYLGVIIEAGNNCRLFEMRIRH